MLRTRLWMGTLLIALGAVILGEGNWAAPWFPVLGLASLAALLAGAREFLLLTPAPVRPRLPLTLGGVALLTLANWWRPVQALLGLPGTLDVWHLLGLALVALLLLAFLVEIYHFRGPEQVTARLGLTGLCWLYLGVLPAFLLQIRWLPGTPEQLNAMLAMTLFVPKCGDIGAYFTGKFLTGRLLGRTPMTPILSPKKTWQGFCGGLLAAVATAWGFERFVPVVPGGAPGAIAFGVAVGLAGVLGDLAESLLKRDLQAKDASRSIPGFGGVLDVVDSILFAAPVAALWWLALR